MKGFSIEWLVSDKEQGTIVRDYLRTAREISRQALTELKHFGKIKVNDNEVTVRHLLQAGDLVSITFPSEKRSEGMMPIFIPFDLIYEDDYVLVINKQANLPTIPSKYHPNYSLANAVLDYYDKQGISSTFHAVNRLDKDTSGLLIVAKHRYAHDLFAKQQQKGNIQRTYLAIVHGIVSKNEGTIDAPIGRKDTSIIEREVRRDGQRAVTHFRVINRFDDMSIVELGLETGRTHQIRVHMSSIGHPLLGDDLYGGETTKIARQALHSSKVEFFHPGLKKQLTFETNVPEDMAALY